MKDHKNGTFIEDVIYRFQQMMNGKTVAKEKTFDL